MEQKIAEFLAGNNPQQYIVSVDGTYYTNYVYLVINDSKTGKRIEKHQYRPFFWVKEEVFNILFDGNINRIKKEFLLNKITVKKLRTTNDNGEEHERMKTGYKYLVESSLPFVKIMDIFKRGGVNYLTSKYKDLFFYFSPEEQFLIQTERRLFKGVDDYNLIHKLVFDLETSGLNPELDRIISIGIKDNRDFEIILDDLMIDNSNLDEYERQLIISFFMFIEKINPDIICGFNSENFDFNFLIVRAQKLNVDIKKYFTGIDNISIKRIPNCKVKYGEETESYTKTKIYGYNVIDTYHAVRRAQAIDTDIKYADLKYISKYLQISKKNRVYISHKQISKLWDILEKKFYLDENNGIWGTEYIENSINLSGRELVRKYLLDDLYETIQVDNILNQSSFLLTKMLPTTFENICTSGTASLWTLLLSAWAYKQGNAIPSYTEKRNYIGGLSRIFTCGYFDKYVKLDYSGLYPKTCLTWSIFPSFDIDGSMMFFLKYFVQNRDHYKNLMNKYKKRIKEIKDGLKTYDERNLLTEELMQKSELIVKQHEQNVIENDKKQLPLKIFNNSFYGSLGSAGVFPWADIDCAEEITCRGRQYLRLMGRYFMDLGFKPLILDTDGINFGIINNYDDFKYTTKGKHYFYEKGKTYSGIEGIVAKFNEEKLFGFLGLDIDELGDGTINCRRKNYIVKIKNKIKIKGNILNSKTIEGYIEEFLNKGIEYLINNKGQEFIEYYNDYVEKIYNYQIPIYLIASKSRVKLTVDEYLDECKKTTKSGNLKSRQAHMELIIKHNLNVNLGDTIYYINTGTKVSHGDVKNDNGNVCLNCEYVPYDIIEHKVVDYNIKYNVPRYLEKFNNRISVLLVVFKPEIRDKILRKIVFDKNLKIDVLTPRISFTKKECELINGIPLDPAHQDDIMNDFLILSDKEIAFWKKINKIPNDIDLIEWENYIKN